MNLNLTKPTTRQTRNRLAVPLAASSIAASITLSLAASLSSAVTVNTSGSFLTEIDNRRQLAFNANSNLYVAPTTTQLASFRTLADGLWSGNFLGTGSTTLDTQAAALGYEYVRFADTDSGQTYYGLREKLTAGNQTKGWGTFYVNFNAVSNTIVEAPHVTFDINTEELSARIFANGSGRGYLLAGANRNANGTGTADVAHLPTSAFQTVHESFNGPAGETMGWSIHGFDLNGFPSWPATTDAIASATTGGISAEVLDIDRRFESVGFETYAYNTLSTNNANNVAVNGTLPGSTFSGLAGSSNNQGEYSRALGGRFLHIEMEQSIRFDPGNVVLAAIALADAMRATNPITTNILKKWDGGTLGTSTSWAVNSASSWSTDGLPVATDTIFFDTTLDPVLPTSMTLSATNITIKNFVWNAPTSSALTSGTSGSSSSTILLLGDAPISTAPLLQVGTLTTTGSFTFTNSNTGGGSGRVVLELGASGPIDVINPGATLQIDSLVTENFPGRRISKTGAGTLLLNNASNNFTGGIEFAGGTLSTAAIGATGASPASLDPDFYAFNGGTFRYTGSTATLNTNRGMTVLANGGTLQIASAAATLTVLAPIDSVGGGTFNVAGAGTLAASRIRVGALNVLNPRVRITPGRNVANTSVVASINLNGNTLDLGDNDLIVDYTGTSPATAIRTLLRSAWNNGTWTGPGITSSIAATNATMIGYAEQSALGTTSFNGLPINATTLVLRHTLPGDATLSGTVDSIDFTRLVTNFGKTNQLWSAGDFNYDGTVDTTDFNLLLTGIGRSVPSSLPAGSPIGTTVPEPASAGLLVMSLCATRRRRRQTLE